MFEVFSGCCGLGFDFMDFAFKVTAKRSVLFFFLSLFAKVGCVYDIPTNTGVFNPRV